jgi:hypothetical protein
VKTDRQRIEKILRKRGIRFVPVAPCLVEIETRRDRIGDDGTVAVLQFTADGELRAVGAWIDD